jgi:hypothetical protein
MYYMQYINATPDPVCQLLGPSAKIDCIYIYHSGPVAENAIFEIASKISIIDHSPRSIF